MRLTCPHCGARDLSEFIYFGDARSATGRLADGDSPDAIAERVYLRDNPAGRHRELWYHGYGCRSWLEVERCTLTHAVHSVQRADAARARAAPPALERSA